MPGSAANERRAVDAGYQMCPLMKDYRHSQHLSEADSGVDVDAGARSVSEHGEQEVFAANELDYAATTRNGKVFPACAVVDTAATATAATEAAAAESPYVRLDSVMCGTAPTALTPVMSPVTGYVVAICGDNSRGPAPLPPPPPPHDQPAHVPVSRRTDVDPASCRDDVDVAGASASQHAITPDLYCILSVGEHDQNGSTASTVTASVPDTTDGQLRRDDRPAPSILADNDRGAHLLVPVSQRPDADPSSRRDAEVASRRDPCSVVSARDEDRSRSGRLDTVARQSQHGDPPPPPPPPSAAKPHFAGSDYISLDQLHSNRVLDDRPPPNDSAM